MDRIVTADIGGTHARFALASIEGGRVAGLDAPVTLKTADHGSLRAAWHEFGRRAGIGLPTSLAMAAAGPVDGDVIALTNNPWAMRRSELGQALGVRRLLIVNDFGAVAHAVASLPAGEFRHLCGPSTPLPDHGVISIVGPGTGLGVAILSRTGDGYQVIETEGGHVDFAPLDRLDERILAELRPRFGRVSVERVASGPGLRNLYSALAVIDSRPATIDDDKALWAAAQAGTDDLAAAALDRLCRVLGSAAGDFALAHGAAAVVIAGGLGRRLADHLPGSGFGERFMAKGRFAGRMREIPVKIVTHPEPGLFGAAAAFALEHG